MNRDHKIILDTIKKLDLNLKNLVILTEVASGYFVYLPIIALLADAKKVFAVVNDTKYGKGNDIVINCKQIILQLGLDIDRIEFSINCIPNNFFEEADIITNSGHLRPLNEDKLQYAKKNVVIPIMYEKWELRPTDLDLNYCKNNLIKVAGTWENHPDLLIFNYCKHLMLKLIFEAGYEIYKNNIFIFSSDHYGDLLEDALISLGANKVIKSVSINELYENVKDIDFIFFCDYNNRDILFSSKVKSAIDIDKIINDNSSVGIIHLAGDIDNEFVNSKGLNIYPNKKGESQRMTETLAYLGPNPVLKLLTSGLKVGELMATNKNNILAQY